MLHITRGLCDDRIKTTCSIKDAASDAKRTRKIFSCVARQGLIGVLFETARATRSCWISTQCRSCLIITTYRPASSTPICRSSREASLSPGTHDCTFPTTLTTLPWLTPPAAARCWIDVPTRNSLALRLVFRRRIVGVRRGNPDHHRSPLRSVTGDGLEYNLKTCIPECLVANP